MTNIVSYYGHYHKDANGFTVFHAHPFDKSQDSSKLPKHTHSNSELIWLAFLTASPALLVLVAFAISLYLREIKQRKILKSHSNFSQLEFLTKISHRGPPCLI